MDLNESLPAVFSGEDDGKEDDGQSVASVGEEYEPISDDELDEILADSQKKEDQQEDEKITGASKILSLLHFRIVSTFMIFSWGNDVFVHLSKLFFVTLSPPAVSFQGLWM